MLQCLEHLRLVDAEVDQAGDLVDAHRRRAIEHAAALVGRTEQGGRARVALEGIGDELLALRVGHRPPFGRAVALNVDRAADVIHEGRAHDTAGERAIGMHEAVQHQRHLARLGIEAGSWRASR